LEDARALDPIVSRIFDLGIEVTTRTGFKSTAKRSHPRTLESFHNLIELYEAWGKPEEAEKWRAKLPQTEAVRE
jgi:hypothetical protein